MHTMTPHPHRLPRATLWLLHGLLLLTLAALCCGRSQAQELGLAETAAAALVAADPAPAPVNRLALPERVGLVLHRLGQRVMRLVPGAATRPGEAPLALAPNEPAPVLAELPAEPRSSWELKAAPEPLVALVQMSRPTLKLSSDAEVSLRLVGGVGVMLKSRF